MATLFDDASLVMIPSGYKDDKLYSIKPTDGSGDFTFSRDGSGASPATRVNSAGLIEKGRTNLLLQSNQFDTTWVNSNTTETSGQSGYDGTNNAWLLTKSAASGYIYQTISQSGVSTFSVYAKAGTIDWVRFRINTTGTTASAYYDLANGVLGGVSGDIDAQIESVGNDWYRINLTINATTSQVRIYPADGDFDLTGTSGNIYIQNAQLEKGLVATNYIATTTAAASAGILGDMPRLDYSGGATCPSLLLEPSRTNIFITSEWFGGWDLNAGTTLTYNYATSPEGVQNATRYVGTGTSGFGDKFTLTNGTQYTISAYVKSNTGVSQNCRLIGDSSNISSDLEVTTEWTRIYYTWTSAGLANKTNGLFRDSSNNDIDILVYGMQLEAGSYPTSYIPTHGSATARGGDSCSKTGISSLIGQSEGTLFFELKDTNNFTGYLGVDNGSTGTRILIYGINDQKVYTQVRNATTVIFGATSSVISGGAKAAVAFNSSGSVFYVNGVQVSSGSGTTYTNLSQVTFNHSSQIGAKIKQAVLFDERLTNAELAALTT